MERLLLFGHPLARVLSLPFFPVSEDGTQETRAYGRDSCHDGSPGAKGSPHRIKPRQGRPENEEILKPPHLAAFPGLADPGQGGQGFSATGPAGGVEGPTRRFPYREEAGTGSRAEQRPKRRRQGRGGWTGRSPKQMLRGIKCGNTHTISAPKFDGVLYVCGN